MRMSMCRTRAIGSGVPYKETGQFAVVSEHGMPARLSMCSRVLVGGIARGRHGQPCIEFHAENGELKQFFAFHTSSCDRYA